MDLQPKHYLLIYALIVTPIVISFFFIRRRQDPARLNLNRENAAKPSEQLAGQPSPASEKVLNVLFNWNGHDWDAYEVLGLPAGSSVESVTVIYQKLLTQSEPDTLLFYKAAFEAIQKSHQIHATK